MTAVCLVLAAAMRVLLLAGAGCGAGGAACACAPPNRLPSSAWFEKASPSSCVDYYDPSEAKKELADGGFSNTPLDFASVTDISDLVPLADLAAAEFSAVGAKIDRNQMNLARYSQVVFNGSPPQYGLTIMSTQYDITEMASCPDPAWPTLHPDVEKAVAEVR